MSNVMTWTVSAIAGKVAPVTLPCKVSVVRKGGNVVKNG